MRQTRSYVKPAGCEGDHVTGVAQSHPNEGEACEDAVVPLVSGCCSLYIA